jgi:uncharacterized protein (DUF1330 family)
MTVDPAQPFTIAFVGYAGAATAERAAAFEDAVLALLEDHGARVAYRGRRAAGQDDALPFEVHLLEFPSRDAFSAYLDDDRRAALLAEFGEVFTVKHAVEIDPITGPRR